MSIDRWMNKDVKYIYIYVIKKWNLAVCDNIDGSKGYYAKWNKSDKDKTKSVQSHL